MRLESPSDDAARVSRLAAWVHDTPPREGRPRRAAPLPVARRRPPGLGRVPGGGHAAPRPPGHGLAGGDARGAALAARRGPRARPRRLRHEGRHRRRHGRAGRHGPRVAAPPGLAAARARRGGRLGVLPRADPERGAPSPPGARPRAVAGRRRQGGAQGLRHLPDPLPRPRRARGPGAGEGRLGPRRDGAVRPLPRGPRRRRRGARRSPRAWPGPAARRTSSPKRRSWPWTPGPGRARRRSA